MNRNKTEPKTKEEGQEPSSLLYAKKAELNTLLTKLTVAKSHTLAWIVIGGILLVVGLIFLFISFKTNSIGEKKFAPQSMEFIFCCICLSIGLIGESYGLIRTLLLSRKIKETKKALVK